MGLVLQVKEPDTVKWFQASSRMGERSVQAQKEWVTEGGQDGKEHCKTKGDRGGSYSCKSGQAPRPTPLPDGTGESEPETDFPLTTLQLQDTSITARVLSYGYESDMAFSKSGDDPRSNLAQNCDCMLLRSQSQTLQQSADDPHRPPALG